MIHLKSIGAIHFPTPEMLNKKKQIFTKTPPFHEKDITALNGKTRHCSLEPPVRGPRSKNYLEDLGG